MAKPPASRFVRWPCWAATTTSPWLPLRVEADAACRGALDALLRLSLVTPREISSPVVNNVQLVVKPAKSQPCLDETASSLPVDYEGEMKPPVPVRRPKPEFPRAALQGSGNTVVQAETVITTEGCIHDMKLLRGAPLGDLNRAAVLALAKWKFRPATLNGVPVDAVFILSVNFRE
ncbi:MAG TPA: energy transducer TonB [Thermoanaerobaculia bacterium]